MAANTSDFLGGGGANAYVDPFTGMGPDQTDAQRAQNQQDSNQFTNQQTDAKTAAANSAFYNSQQHQSYLPVNPRTNKYIDPNTGADLSYGPGDKPATGSFLSTIAPTLKAISKDPVTMGILLAPYGVTAAGAAAGGLASGGAGTIADTGANSVPYAYAASDAPTLAAPTADAATAGTAGTTATTDTLPAITTSGATEVPTMAAPAALPTTAASAAAPTLGGVASKIGSAALPALIEGAGMGYLQSKNKNTDAENALIAKQQQMAGDAQARMNTAAQERMDGLATRLMAFNPMNQMMASMYGPQAAFSPQQMAGMAANPVAPSLDPSLMAAWQADANGTGPHLSQQQLQVVRKYQEQMAAYQQAESARQQLLQTGITPLPAGPTPIRATQVAPARKY